MGDIIKMDEKKRKEGVKGRREARVQERRKEGRLKEGKKEKGEKRSRRRTE